VTAADLTARCVHVNSRFSHWTSVGGGAWRTRSRCVPRSQGRTSPLPCLVWFGHPLLAPHLLSLGFRLVWSSSPRTASPFAWVSFGLVILSSHRISFRLGFVWFGHPLLAPHLLSLGFRLVWFWLHVVRCYYRISVA
jgi:hypothetical protein